MSRPMSAADPAPIFSALGDPTRLKLVRSLSGCSPQSISTLSARSRLTRQAVTKHLRVLERAGLVHSARAGRESRYAFCPQPVAAARAYLDAVSAQWDGALERLRTHVEEE